MIIADAGSTWCKIYDSKGRSLSVEPTAKLAQLKPSFDIATGHSGRPYAKTFENELIALAEGAKLILNGCEADFTVVDVGSRDIKFVKFAEGRPANMDWSSGCASSTGATIEMLGRFYDLDFSTLPISDVHINVTCGTFGLEKIMDSVAAGESAAIAVSQFIHGLVRNIFNFLGRPEKLYLSGGFCENAAFLSYLSKYCAAVPLGRFALIAGLCKIRGVKFRSEEELKKIFKVKKC